MKNRVISNDEIYHYGVPGMKWGIRRASYKSGQNSRLNKKVKKYEVKAAKMKKKSEKIHAKEDLGVSNRNATKAANYQKKAAKLRYKATVETNSTKKSMYEAKAARYELKAAKRNIKAETLAKTASYGTRAMKYALKSDKAKAKAAKAKAKIASNELFINRMNSKLSSITDEQRAQVQDYIDKYMR